MAGDWIKLQYWRSKCPEIVRVASASGRTRHEVLGLLCDFWSWVSTETQTGTVVGVFVSDLPDLVGADARFWGAVVAAGWLSEDGSGLVVPGWDHWLSDSAKKRATEAIRKRAERSGQFQADRPDPPARPPAVRNPSAKRRTESATREEKRREEEGIPPNPPAGGGVQAPAKGRPAKPGAATVPIPAALDTPEFRSAWSDWLADRKDRNKPVTAKAAELQFAKLAPLGPAEAVRWLRNAIAQGWTGLYPPAAPRPPGGMDRVTEYALKTALDAAGLTD